MNGAKKMPVKTRRVSLEGDLEGFWIEWRTSMTVETFERLEEVVSEMDTEIEDSEPETIKQVAGTMTGQIDGLRGMFDLLADSLSDWNLTDDRGNALSLDAEGFKKIPIVYLRDVFGTFTAGLGALPKESSETLSS